MGRLLALSAALVFVLSSCAIDALAYTPTLTQSGKPVRWQGDARFNLAGNPVNQSGISALDFFQSVTRSLQRWNAASADHVGFNYWQGTDRSIYEPNSEYNGLSSIYFASNAPGLNLSPNVLGLTQVWYNTDSGEILEADVVLNDLNYRFSTDPHDTSGYGTIGSGGFSGPHNVFIENVLTHELGHAYGLSHSGGLQSTMLFMESPEQAYLGCDEQVAIHALYSPEAVSARGAITGVVLSEQGNTPVFGAHVLAISRRRGTVLATALTDRTGHYALVALEPGTYYLMAEPFFAGASALPGYYSGINSHVCNGESFGRTGLMEGSTNRMAAVVLNQGAAVQVPPLVAKCGTDGRAALASGAEISSTISSAPVMFDADRGDPGFGFSDRFGPARTLNYRLKNVSGRLELHALGYSLYSPIHPSITLLDPSGTDVSADHKETVYTGTSGFVNYDSSVTAVDLPRGDYIVQVNASALNAALYPAGPVSLDSVPFVIVTGSLNEGEPALASTLPVNARCRMSEDFAAYVSPPGLPPRREKEDLGGVGFCGTLANRGDGDGKGGSGGTPPGPAAVFSWFLPWLAMGAFVRLARLRELRTRPGCG